MNIIKILEIKRECKKLQQGSEGPDCNKCPLTGKVILKLAVESYGALEEGDIKVPVNPCLLLEELSNVIKKR